MRRIGAQRLQEIIGMTSQLTYRHYKTPGGDIPYVRLGRGPTLFLLPAFHSDIERFAPFLTYLSRHFDVIMPELPGIGCEARMPGGRYTTDAYAELYVAMIRSFKLTRYILAGVSLGGIILIRMLAKGIKPRKVLVFETFTDGRMLRPYWYQRVLLPLIELSYRSRMFRKVLTSVLLNRNVLTSIIRFVYWNNPDREKIVPYQYRITAMMQPDAVVSVVHEFVNVHLPAGGANRFDVPCVIGYVTHDPIIDTESAIAALSAMFPDSEVLRIPYDDHAPRGPISEREVGGLMRDIVSRLR